MQLKDHYTEEIEEGNIEIEVLKGLIIKLKLV